MCLFPRNKFRAALIPENKFFKIFKVIFIYWPYSSDFIFYKISLQKVTDFEKFIKKHPAKKKA
jgi:hypothetical protein